MDHNDAWGEPETVLKIQHCFLSFFLPPTSGAKMQQPESRSRRSEWELQARVWWC